MNIKRNIIFTLESRKKDGVLIVENMPIRMRVNFASKRIEFTTGYRIDAAKWDSDKQRVKNGCSNKLKESASEINEKMNDYLKELAELEKINEPIHQTCYRGNERIDEVTPKYALLGTHAGRSTFICNALALGIPPQVVMKWTGHSDYKAMKPYIDIADDIKANAMNKFNQL